MILSTISDPIYAYQLYQYLFLFGIIFVLIAVILGFSPFKISVGIEKIDAKFQDYGYFIISLIAFGIIFLNSQSFFSSFINLIIPNNSLESFQKRNIAVAVIQKISTITASIFALVFSMRKISGNFLKNLFYEILKIVSIVSIFIYTSSFLSTFLEFLFLGIPKKDLVGQVISESDKTFIKSSLLKFLSILFSFGLFFSYKTKILTSNLNFSKIKIPLQSFFQKTSKKDKIDEE